MKVLFVCTQFPYPPFSGMKRKILTLAKYFSKMGDEVYLFSLTSPESNVGNKYFKEIMIANESGYIKKIIQVIRYFLKKPIQISIYTNSENVRVLRRYIERIKPDLVFIDYIRAADFGIGIDLLKIINYDDPQSLKFKRMKKFLKEIKNPFGEGIEFFPEFIKRIISLPLMKRIILSYEINTLLKYEVQISKYYPLVLTNSMEDGKYLMKRGIKNVDFLPPLIEKEYYLEKIRNQKEGIITFVGKMDYPPNPNAVEYFIKEIMPRIKKLYHDDFEFRVIGSKTPSWMYSFEKVFKNVRLIGEVEDIRPFLQESTVFVAPLKFGTGIKVKILEAMASGVPVVTTSVGIQGMRVKNGIHIFVEDNPEDFAKKVVLLLKNKDLRKNIAKNAKNYVFSNFDPLFYVNKIRDYVNKKTTQWKKIP